MRRKFTLWAAVVLGLYGLGYGVARWRKVLVMHQYYLKDDGLVVKKVGPGLDVREDWRGTFKNRIAPMAFACFRPLCALENLVRGSVKKYR